jgi:hypothetical protein
MTRENTDNDARHPAMTMGHAAKFGVARDRVLMAQVRQPRFAARRFGRAADPMKGQNQAANLV